MNLADREYNNTLWAIVNFYPNDRLLKLREETAELLSALEQAAEDTELKDDRHRHHVVDEMVDVQIMIDQVRRRFKVGDDEWNLYRDFKLRRQEMRMARSNG